MELTHIIGAFPICALLNSAAVLMYNFPFGLSFLKQHGCITLAVDLELESVIVLER